MSEPEAKPFPPPLSQQITNPRALAEVVAMLDDYCDRMNFQRQIAKIQQQEIKPKRKRR
jgi:hypothetical protein